MIFSRSRGKSGVMLLTGFGSSLRIAERVASFESGMTAEKVHAGVKLALADFAGRGWHPEVCFIKPDETAVPTIERCLADDVYDCVVIGRGFRLPPNRLVLFEAVVNAIHRAAPQAAIAFNTRPEDSGAAAARWV